MIAVHVSNFTCSALRCFFFILECYRVGGFKVLLMFLM
jgi:hypothetical protein